MTYAHRFMAFAGPTYYPSGGTDDLVGVAPTMDEAITLANDSAYPPAEYCNWGIVYDTLRQVTVARCDWRDESWRSNPEGLAE